MDSRRGEASHATDLMVRSASSRVSNHETLLSFFEWLSSFETRLSERRSSG
jgi:hypothetical protein